MKSPESPCILRGASYVYQELGPVTTSTMTYDLWLMLLNPIFCVIPRRARLQLSTAPGPASKIFCTGSLQATAARSGKTPP